MWIEAWIYTKKRRISIQVGFTRKRARLHCNCAAIAKWTAQFAAFRAPACGSSWLRLHDQPV